jgi:hypothetical protein
MLGLAGWLALAAGCAQLKPGIAPPGDGSRQAAAATPAAPARAGLEIAVLRQRRYALHTVRWAEESLGAIALWYTGKADHWKALARVTPNLRGRALTPGDTVFIPEELLRRRDALPRSFVLQARSTRPAAGAADPAAPPPPGAPAPPPGAAPTPETDPPGDSDDFPVRPFGPRVYPGDPAP